MKKKADIHPSRLLVERAKFSLHFMVSAGVSYEGKGRLHFIDEKAKVNAKYYVGNLLPKLVDDCQTVFGNQFIFQQDGDRKSTRLNSSHIQKSRMPSSA